MPASRVSSVSAVQIAVILNVQLFGRQRLQALFNFCLEHLGQGLSEWLDQHLSVYPSMYERVVIGPVGGGLQ